MSLFNRLEEIAAAGREARKPESAANKALVDRARRDPKFKSWFGRSHVTGRGGLPLVCYNASPTGGSYTKPDPAKTKLGVIFFAEEPRTAAFGGRVFKAFLKITNPFMLRERDIEDVVDDLSERDVMVMLGADLDTDDDDEPREQLKQKLGSSDESNVWQDPVFVRALKRSNYDGIITDDTFGGQTEYVVFRANQIMVLH